MSNRSVPAADNGADDGRQNAAGLGRAATGEHRAGAGQRRHRGAGSSLLAMVRELVIVVVSALILSLLIKTFLLQAFFIPSESMERTLEVGDRVLVSKLTPGPLDVHRGDVVVFEDPGGWLPPAARIERGPLGDALASVATFVGLLPEDTGHLIKRVIGLPGDTVACCDSTGHLTVNGAAISEPYVYRDNVPSEIAFKVTVPPGRLWVMGDHRQRSEDSRYHQDQPGTGTIPIDLVVGRAFAVVWPFSRAVGLGDYPTTYAGVPGRRGAD